MKIFSFIKRVWKYVFGGYEKDCIDRELRRIQPFDVVSTVPDPSIHDLYVVYSISEDGSVYIAKWDKYFTSEGYNAGMDAQYVYNLQTASSSLLKVMNYKLKFDVVLKKATPAEFFTFASRACAVMNQRYPLLGLFIDKDDHLMMISDVIDDTCEVVDIDNLTLFGALHTHQFLFMIKTKDLLEKYHPFQFNHERLAMILSRPWNQKSMEWFLEAMARGIRKSERKEYGCDLISAGLTLFKQAPSNPQPVPEKEMVK